MALSKKMYEALLGERIGRNLHFRDGRTVKALYNRGLIYGSYWKNSKGTWTMTLNKRGNIARQHLSSLTGTLIRVFIK